MPLIALHSPLTMLETVRAGGLAPKEHQ